MINIKDLIHVVKFSGGKDSVGMVIKLVHEDIDVKYLVYQFVEGNTPPKVLDYINLVYSVMCKELGISPKLVIIKSEDFIEIMKKHHKPFPNPKTLWCMHWLKIIPLRRWLLTLRVPESMICIDIGVKRTDSKRRSEIYDQKFIRANQVKTKFKGISLVRGNYWIYLPVYDLTDEEVWKLIESYPKLYEIIKSGYRDLVNPSSCIVCPFHTLDFYRRAPRWYLEEALKIIHEIEKLPHIKNFKVGYQLLQKHKKIISSILKSKATVQLTTFL